MDLIVSLKVLCAVGGFVLAAVDLIRSKGQSVLGWAVLLVSLALVLR